MAGFSSNSIAQLSSGHTVRLFTNVNECLLAWDTLLQSGWSAPYQTPCWVGAWLSVSSGPDAAEPCFILLENADGSPACLFPLVIGKRGPVRVAAFCGQKHANFHVGVFDAKQPFPSASVLSYMLAAAARFARIDCYSFFNQPVEWLRQPNPMTTLPHIKSGNSAYRLDLQTDGEELLKTLASGETRKKLRNKEKRLSELGQVSLIRAANNAERAVFLRAFLDQKIGRFAAQGRHNPFADTSVIAFLEAGIRQTREGSVPIEIYALKAGERMCAIIGVAEHGGRASGMFISYDSAPEVSRFSPGDILLSKLVMHLCGRGMAIFDLGTGDATYKESYCPIQEPLFDSVLPMTAKGKAAALSIKIARRARYTLKSNPVAISIYNQLQRLRRQP